MKLIMRIACTFLFFSSVMADINGVRTYESFYTNSDTEIPNKSATKQNLCFKKNRPRIIIFLHGTLRPAKFSIGSVIKVLQDDINNTFYARALDLLRKDSFFYNGQPIQEIGLHKIEPLKDHVLNRTAQVIAEVYNLQFQSQGDTTPTTYYTFGWTGLLSAKKRKEASAMLYTSLQQELKKLKSQGITNPEITFITFSHGGNVVLHLPQAAAECASELDQELYIDNLILLANPIKKETDYLTADPMFGKIVNIYSEEDFVQAWDIFSGQNIGSNRKFMKRRNFNPPRDKITEIRIVFTKRINGVSPEELEKKPGRLATLPLKNFVHRGPGHMEIGLFRWGNYWYREEFPLNPFSVLSFVPTIINAVQKTLPNCAHVVCDFIPQYDSLLLYNKDSKDARQLMPLWPTKNLKETLWEIASKNTPPDYTIPGQEEHIARILQQARRDTFKARKYRKPHNKTLAQFMKKADKLFPENALEPAQQYAMNQKKSRKGHRFSHTLL